MTANLLDGEKVRLTAFTKADIPQFGKWFYEDLDMMRHLMLQNVYPDPPATTQAWLEDYIKQAGTDDFVFSIRTIVDDELIGSVRLFNITWPSRNGYIGISLGGASARGKGYGTDAMRILLRFAFMEINLHRVMLEVFDYNIGAIRSYEKVGFIKEGRLRQKNRRDGQFHDIVRMGILRREWLALHHPDLEEPE